MVYAAAGAEAQMRAIGTLLVGCLAVACLAAPTSASAAATRAEYIAQVDPICQAFVVPANDADRAFSRNYKRWVRALFKGTLKGWVRQTERTARSLMRSAQIHASLTGQIAAVPPFPADAGTIGNWLNSRRQADAFARSAAVAFGQFKFKVFDRRLRQADAADDAGRKAIFGYGFQVCGVSVR